MITYDILYTHIIELTISPLAVAGGCGGDACSDRVKVNKTDTIIIRSYKSKNMNCVIACYNNAYGVKGNVLKPETVRKDLGLTENTMVHMDVLIKLTEYYNEKFGQTKGFQLINEKFEII